MEVQKTLDKNKSYGQVIGGGGVAFTQNGLEFGADGKRLTAITDEEKIAIKAENDAIKAKEKAEADRYASLDKLIEKVEKKKEAREKAKKTDDSYLPDGFYKWARADLVNYGRNKFGIELKGNLNQIRAKIKSLL